jgi:hypothetical protein
MKNGDKMVDEKAGDPEQAEPKRNARQRSQQEVEEKLNQVRLRTAEVQLQEAEMKLEQTEEQIRQFENDKAMRSRANSQRQAQFKMDINQKAATARTCKHRQGASIRNPYGGKGPSALQRMVMPDERTLIMCSICPLAVFSPFPGDGSRKRRRNETEQQAQNRLAKYEADMAEFAKLEDHCADKLTDEAGMSMHCGKTFQFRDGDGNQVQVPSPCDSYAQGRDNREGVR